MPPRTWRTWPQETHRAHRCWQALHHGRPVVTEMVHGAVRRQIAHSAICHGRQLAQRGPSSVRTLTDRRRWHSTQTSWLIGSTIRQAGHRGRPCSSRVAASRIAPQRAHGWARDLAVQLRHNHFPPIGTALRVAHHIGALDLQGAQQRRGIVAELLVRHLARGIRGATVPLLIEDDHGALAREGGHPRRHRVGGHERAGDEQQRRQVSTCRARHTLRDRGSGR